MKVYLSEKLDPAALEKLRQRAEIVDNFDHIEDIDAIILRTVPVTAEMMDRAKKLKVIGKHGVGYDSIDILAAKRRNIQVVFTPGANAESVAELIVGTMLDASRNISAAFALSKDGRAQKGNLAKLRSMDIQGKAVGMIGFGNVARKAASILRGGFQTKIYACDEWVDDRIFEEFGAVRCQNIRQVIEVSDFVNISVPLNDSTRNMISDEQLSWFKKDAVLINAARGGIVNEQALYRALTNGTIRAAACDAFVSEPPSLENPLLSLPNFVATPHIGGSTVEAEASVGLSVVEDVLGVLDGRPPVHPVP